MRTLLAIALFACMVLALRAAPSSGDTYENAEFGFKFRPPPGWTQIPIATEERWQVAKFLSDKTYFYNDKTSGWSAEHKPEFTVIAFITEVTRKKIEVEKKEEKDKTSISILIKNPYKDYLDYLKRTHTDGGFYVSDEKDVTLDGLSVKQYEIKVEKLTQTGPKRIIAWVFKQPEIEFAVQVEVLEGSYSKLQNLIEDTLRSFKVTRKSGGVLLKTDGGEKDVFEDLGKLSQKERTERRKALETKTHAAAQKGLPSDWQVIRTKRFLVLSHTDEKYARRVADQGEAIFAWLEATFPFVGPGEYVRQPVLRICKDDDELRSYEHGSSGFFFFGSAPAEIVTDNDQSGFTTGYSVERVNRDLLQLWFEERDLELATAVPSWLNLGLGQVLGTARVDRTTGKLEFRIDDWERDGVRESIRDKSIVKPRDMLKMIWSDFADSSKNFWSRDKEAGSFVRFLVAGPGARDAKCKDLLRDYIKSLKAVITELNAADKKAEGTAEKKPTTEEEEEAAFKANGEKWKKREQALLDQTYQRCFRSWTDAQWKELEDAYFKGVQ